MSKDTSLGESMNTTSKKIKVECSEVPVVNIPSKIFSDVYYLHSKYPGKEWSGHLYFTKKGDINDPNNLIIDVQEFVLLDLGTAGATEIDPTGEQVIDMYTNRPQILSMQQALLHTHHSMRTFFSGTDWDTLLENASNYPFFLSVIVNNEGATIAKISLQGFIEESETTNTFKYKFNKGFLEKIITKEKKVTEVIYVYTCKINIENSVDEDFNKLLELKQAKQLLLNEKNNSFNSFIGDNGSFRREFEDDWNYSGIGNSNNINPRSNNFKRKPHKEYKQTNLFKEVVQKPSIKDLTIEFLTCLLLQDTDLNITHDITYSQAIEMWDEEVGIEMLKEFKDFIRQTVEECFNNIFGEEVLQEDLNSIKANVNIILGNSTPEVAIKPIINKYLNSIK